MSTLEKLPAKRRPVPWHSQLFHIIVLPTKTQIAPIDANLIKIQLLYTPVTSDTYRRVAVAKDATLAPYTHTPVLAASCNLGTVVLKSVNEHAGYTSVQAARELVTVAPNKLFHIHVINVSETLVHIPNCMIVGYVTNIMALIMVTEIFLLKSDPKLLRAVDYKPLVDRDA